MKIQLICLDENAAEASTMVDEFPAIVGRDASSVVRMTNVWASRKHCCLEMRDSQLFVRDLGSQNGILVNGELVDESRLRSGDRIAVGLTEFSVQFLCDDAPSTYEHQHGVWNSLMSLYQRSMVAFAAKPTEQSRPVIAESDRSVAHVACRVKYVSDESHAKTMANV